MTNVDGLDQYLLWVRPVSVRVLLGWLGLLVPWLGLTWRDEKTEGNEQGQKIAGNCILYGPVMSV